MIESYVAIVYFCGCLSAAALYLFPSGPAAAQVRNDLRSFGRQHSDLGEGVTVPDGDILLLDRVKIHSDGEGHSDFVLKDENNKSLGCENCAVLSLDTGRVHTSKTIRGVVCQSIRDAGFGTARAYLRPMEAPDGSNLVAKFRSTKALSAETHHDHTIKSELLNRTRDRLGV